MAHPIDPTVDYAFRVLFSKQGNEPILTHFLNAVFEPQGIHLNAVLIINPYNDKEFAEDKLTIVDVKATDENGRQIQIEIQLTNPSWLPARMIFTWSEIFCAQLGESENYDLLNPVFSIWILGKIILPQSPAMFHRFVLYDPVNKVTLGDHLTIYVLELPKCPPESKIESALETWAYLFEHGKEIDPANPPELLKNGIMGKVMTVLQGISEVSEDFWAYKNRVNAQRLQRTIESDHARSKERARKAERQLVLEHTQAEQQLLLERTQAERRIEQERTLAERRLEQRLEQERTLAEQRFEQIAREHSQARQAMLDNFQQLLEANKASPEDLGTLFEESPVSADETTK